jgi:hypothetical protein
MFESHHVSRYFDNRRYQSRLKARGKSTPGRANRQRSKTARRLPKLSLAVHAASHLILAARVTTGLGNDHPHFIPLLQRAASRMGLSWVVADAGFDSESNHRAARRDLKIRSLIPATCGRPGVPRGYYRRLMRWRLQKQVDKRRYGQRWQVETVNSMVKRNLGSSCRSRTAWGRKRDLLLRAITHNLMIVENL